jgi:hypothetical protein
LIAQNGGHFTPYSKSTTSDNGRAPLNAAEMPDKEDNADQDRHKMATSSASSSTTTTIAPEVFEKEALALQVELAQMQQALQDRMQRYQDLTTAQFPNSSTTNKNSNNSERGRGNK